MNTRSFIKALVAIPAAIKAKIWGASEDELIPLVVVDQCRECKQQCTPEEMQAHSVWYSWAMDEHQRWEFIPGLCKACYNTSMRRCCKCFKPTPMDEIRGWASFPGVEGTHPICEPCAMKSIREAHQRICTTYPACKAT